MALICGLASEAKALATSGLPIAVTGARLDRAEAAIRAALDAGCRHLISIGLAGGLDPALPSGTVMVAQTMHHPHGRLATVDLPQIPGRRAPGYTRAEPVLTPEDRLRLHHQSGAAFIETESLGMVALGEQARAAGLDFSVVRVVADTAFDTVPAFAFTAIKPDGRIDLGRILAGLARQPLAFGTLMHLASRSRVAHKQLADVGRRLPAVSGADREAFSGGGR